MCAKRVLHAASRVFCSRSERLVVITSEPVRTVLFSVSLERLRSSSFLARGRFCFSGVLSSSSKLLSAALSEEPSCRFWFCVSGHVPTRTFLVGSWPVLCLVSEAARVPGPNPPFPPQPPLLVMGPHGGCLSGAGVGPGVSSAAHPLCQDGMGLPWPCIWGSHTSARWWFEASDARLPCVLPPRV